MNTQRYMRRSRATADARLQVRENGGGAESRTITGYAIIFDTPSELLYADASMEIREVIAPEAVTRELLDRSDIKFTMFHDRQIILGRSNKGKGTLSYEIDDTGVRFELELPRTAEGDKALEAVRRGDISGCSFAFSTDYDNRTRVSRDVTEDPDGMRHVTYTVRAIDAVYDFTLAADPAYPDTSVESREAGVALHAAEASSENVPAGPSRAVREQVSEMRRHTSARVFTDIP